MQKITSKENEFIKHIKKLKDKKYRDQSNEYIIEGIKLIQEAIQEKAQIHQIVICEDCEKSGIISQELKYEIAKQECVYVPQNIFKTISEVSTPQGILAIVEKNNIKNKDSEIDYNQDIIVALDDIQDPKFRNNIKNSRQYRLKTNTSIKRNSRQLQSKSSTLNNGSNIQSKNNRM